LNGLAPDRVEWVKANVFEDLRVILASEESLPVADKLLQQLTSFSGC
jgi:hypothetical protein